MPARARSVLTEPGEQTSAPRYDEIGSAAELVDSDRVFESLRAIDWSFTEADTGFLSHDIHPYPAKFIPQIPGHLISRLSLRGEVVMDPFGGSGTTAMEALRLGRRAVSVDANPVATLIGRVKTARPDPGAMAELGSIRKTLARRARRLPASPTRWSRQFAEFVPEIPNLTKWFPPTSCAELALIRACIARTESRCARDIAQMALSRVVLRASFQDSETRYASRPREIAFGDTLARFLDTLSVVSRKVRDAAAELDFGVATFHTGDARRLHEDTHPDSSVDLIATSPPYGNSHDYHLYHRFRMFWLGFDPRSLGKIEIGSHLRHQKENSGFASYAADMRACLVGMHRVLKRGRYAALVVGDAIYRGQIYASASALGELGQDVGFEVVGAIARPIHATRRSFVTAGRRAQSEHILILRKPARTCRIGLISPNYRMWPYEQNLRMREVKALLGVRRNRAPGTWTMPADLVRQGRARRLAFTHAIRHGARDEPTWQRILECGLDVNGSARKDSKYVTHGIHAYKGKFYPQLAKALINITGVGEGATVLDPFCGSGTALLEAALNGLRARGCDLHPLAAQIARVKLGVLDLRPRVVREAAGAVTELLCPGRVPRRVDQFRADALDEIERWFPGPVIYKLNWLLAGIRAASSSVLREFFEVLVSSIIRGVSQQEPRDLRIRRRKQPIEDADVFGLFHQHLDAQLARLEQFWKIRGYSPYRLYPAHVVEGDAREPATLRQLGVAQSQVDVIVTSPPYATALPYIDTDRLSLLVLFGMTSKDRRPLETTLTGSREISRPERDALERAIAGDEAARLPGSIARLIGSLYRTNTPDKVGFRRRNLPSLLLRFFRDMQQILTNCLTALKPGGDALIVIGDNVTQVADQEKRIATTELLAVLAQDVGFEFVERIPITVTTQNLAHIRNAITENTVVRLRRPA